MSEDKDVARTELKIWLFHTIGNFKYEVTFINR